MEGLKGKYFVLMVMVPMTAGILDSVLYCAQEYLFICGEEQSVLPTSFLRKLMNLIAFFPSYVKIIIWY